MHPANYADFFIILVGICLIVPLSSRFHLGSVIGFILVGAVIGPHALGLVSEQATIIKFSELGVIMMLFLIGLELHPRELWHLRSFMLGMGSLQMLGCIFIISAVSYYFMHFLWQESLAIAIILSVSSTAIILQSLKEHGLINHKGGVASFAVLIMQDIFVIFMLILLPLIAQSAPTSEHDNMIGQWSGLSQTLVIGLVILCMFIFGKYIARPLFLFIARTHNREVFTATSLALVIGTTILMSLLGLSPGLGAFLAGIILANSDFKHTIEADIMPFKGLLLGIFFISVGININFHYLWENFAVIIAILAGFLALKSLFLWPLARLFHLKNGQDMLFTVALAGGGEFAFVLVQFCQNLGLINANLGMELTIAITLSMILSPILLICHHFMYHKKYKHTPETGQKYDEIDQKSPIIMAGFGRFGQVIERFLKPFDIQITVLENNIGQIEMIRKFGRRAFYGDASNLDILRSAGAEQAKIFIIAVDNDEICLKIAKILRQHFPHLRIYSRARNRRHAFDLYKLGVDVIKRETLDSSVAIAGQILQYMTNWGDETIQEKMKIYLQFDEKTLHESFEFFEKEGQLINYARDKFDELQILLQAPPKK